MKRKPRVHVKRPLSEIRASLNCSIPEAARLMGYSRFGMMQLIASGELATFVEGKRVRVVTESLIEYQARKVAEAKGKEAS